MRVRTNIKAKFFKKLVLFIIERCIDEMISFFFVLEIVCIAVDVGNNSGINVAYNSIFRDELILAHDLCISEKGLPFDFFVAFYRDFDSHFFMADLFE